jgi:hypothetical protein
VIHHVGVAAAEVLILADQCPIRWTDCDTAHCSRPALDSDRPKTPEIELVKTDGGDNKAGSQSAWELKRVKPSERELANATTPGTFIAAVPNNFAGKPTTREHAPGGAYVPDRLLEAHRRMHATDRGDDELLTQAMQTSVAPKPKSLMR